MKKSCDELRRCSRDTQLKFVFVFVRVSSVSPAEPLLELSSQPVALKYYYSTTVLLPYFYGTTVLLLYYYCTTAHYQGSDLVDCGGECRLEGKVFNMKGI